MLMLLLSLATIEIASFCIDNRLRQMTFFRVCKVCKDWLSSYVRSIEWSLRALASMRALRLFLRARAVIQYVLRAASTS